MIADHFWRFDTMQKINYVSSVNDERGSLRLEKTSHMNGELYRGQAVGLFNSTETAISGSLPSDDCLSNIALCKDGISIAFALKGKTCSLVQR